MAPDFALEGIQSGKNIGVGHIDWMVTNRGRDGSDRTIGRWSGSNDNGAIFALTFTAIDTIVINIIESISH